MRITVVYTDIQFSNPIAYTFDSIFSILGVEYNILAYPELAVTGIDNNVLVISYGREKVDLNVDYQIHIYQSKLFGKDYNTASSMPQLPLKYWSGLPVIYEGNGDIGSLVVRRENLVETNVDIIASSFFMLSRYEEVILDVKDEHDRFPAESSVAYKENFLTRPIVNEYIDLLWEWIDGLNLGFRRKLPWNDRDFAVLLTHDVDELRKYRWWRPPLYSFGRSIKERQPGKMLRYAWDWIASSLGIKQDPYWTFDRISELEHKCDFRSAFYFIAGGNSKLERN